MVDFAGNEEPTQISRSLHSPLPRTPPEFQSQVSLLCHKGIAVALIPTCFFTLAHAWLAFLSA